jgi:hypothetical protein
MKASLVANDVRELYKILKVKKEKRAYVRGCPKWQLTQTWLLEILGVRHILTILLLIGKDW